MDDVWLLYTCDVDGMTPVGFVESEAEAQHIVTCLPSHDCERLMRVPPNYIPDTRTDMHAKAEAWREAVRAGKSDKQAAKAFDAAA